VHQLGGSAVAVFPAGGLSGESLCRLLAREEVAAVAVRIDGVTRESFAVVERQSGKQYRFLLPGPHLTPCDQTKCLEAFASHTANCTYVVASGSLPPGCPADFYAKVAMIARERGARLVLDTSGAALAGAGPHVFLMKTSLHELEQWSGTLIRNEVDQEKIAQQVIGCGCAEVLVLSLGAQGALLVTSQEIHRFPAIAVEALSSVGAGDSMVAGIVLSLTRGWILRDAVRFGIAAGAAALLRPGTELCRREDTERLYHANS
jgi:6-phosphofructokinase 2